MRAVWKGSVSFGLVNIPVALYSATKREDIRFRQLRKDDLSPINYKRVAEVDGKEVAWEDLVKGYEYEKGRFVVLNDEDFERVDIEATQTVDILDFVDLEQIDSMFFQKPYYLEPQRGGEKAYVLLRDTLEKTGKTGIAKVVIKTKQYLAAVKPKDQILIMELMHFADEIVSTEGLNVPKEQKIAPKEIQTATALVESLTVDWEPERYEDDYRIALMELIEEKIEGGERVAVPSGGKRPATDVVDLVKVLQESLASAKKGGKEGAKPKKKQAAAAKKRPARTTQERPATRSKKKKSA